MIRLIVIALALIVGMARAAEAPPDKDMTILLLRRALAEERIERMRLDYLATKAELDKIVAEIAAKEKDKEKPHEKK